MPLETLPWPLSRDQPSNGKSLDGVLCGQVESTRPPVGSAAIWTLDDTESRLLSDLPPTVSLLLLCGSWTYGCEFGVSQAVKMSADLFDSITRLDWNTPASGQPLEIQRPALTPQPWTALPDWMAAAFQSWRSKVGIRSSVEATALEAGLRQMHGDLDGSHQCAQSIEGAGWHHGDYWHAIMHRREPDYGNSQYWFRRVGRHPVFEPLAKEAASVAERFPAAAFQHWLSKLLSGGTWNPMAFVDCVAAAAETDDQSFRRAVEEVQYREMLLLFAQTYRDAV